VADANGIVGQRKAKLNIADCAEVLSLFSIISSRDCANTHRPGG